MAGVYQVAKHYEFETQRGVQHLSTMEAAMGGQSRFADLSPLLQLEHAAPAAPWIANLPPFVLMSSTSDGTVQSSQSEAMMQAALAAGIDAAHVVYSHTSHVDFATSWTARQPSRAHDRPQLAAENLPRMAHVSDVVAVIKTRSPAQLRSLLQRHRSGPIRPQPAVTPRPLMPSL
jgi:hypothetical protein